MIAVQSTLTTLRAPTLRDYLEEGKEHVLTDYPDKRCLTCALTHNVLTLVPASSLAFVLTRHLACDMYADISSGMYF